MEQATGRIDKAPLMALVDGIVIHIGELEIDPETGNFVGVNITHERRAAAISINRATKNCDTAFSDRSRNNSLWCFTHDQEADHVAPDGDSMVCKTYADIGGCNCCPENYEKARS
jgi:hypothetical protein